MSRITDEAVLQHVADEAAGAAALAARALAQEDRGAGYTTLTSPSGELIGVVVVTFRADLAERLIDMVAGFGNHSTREVS